MTATPINWTALRHVTGDVPWEAVEHAIATVAGEPGSWDELADVYTGVRGCKEWICRPLYVRYILGEAGSQLADAKDRSVRERIEAFLLKGLLDGWNRGDDFALTALQYACGRMGPAILPQVLQRIKGARWIAEPPVNCGPCCVGGAKHGCRIAGGYRPAVPGAGGKRAQGRGRSLGTARTPARPGGIALGGGATDPGAVGPGPGR